MDYPSRVQGTKGGIYRNLTLKSVGVWNENEGKGRENRRDKLKEPSTRVAPSTPRCQMPRLDHRASDTSRRQSNEVFYSIEFMSSNFNRHFASQSGYLLITGLLKQGLSLRSFPALEIMHLIAPGTSRMYREEDTKIASSVLRYL